jgi:hypothetical protein
MTPTDPTALDPPGTTAPPAGTAAPTIDLLAEPTFEECIEQWNHYDEDGKAGHLNGVDVPGGHYFAYYAGRIIDHDPDYMNLCARAAMKAGVHWARLVIRYCQLWV